MRVVIKCPCCKHTIPLIFTSEAVFVIDQENQNMNYINFNEYLERNVI